MKDLHVRCSEQQYCEIQDRATKLNYPSVHAYMLDRLISDKILVEDISSRDAIIASVQELIGFFQDNCLSKSAIPNEVVELVKEIKRLMNEGWTAKVISLEDTELDR